MRRVTRPVAWMREIDAFRAALPFELSSLFSTVCGMVGRIDETFVADDDGMPPVLDYHEWLLSDLTGPAGASGAMDGAARAGLFACGYFMLAAHHAERAVLLAVPGFGPEYALVAARLHQAADRCLARLVPADAPAWPSIDRMGLEGASGMLALRERVCGRADAMPRPLSAEGAQWAGFAALSLATAQLCGRDAMLPALAALVARMNAIWQIHADVLNLRRDIEHGTPSYAIARLRRQTGLPLPSAAQQAFAIFLSTGCAQEIAVEVRGEAVATADTARALELLAVAAHIDALAAALGAMANALAATRRAMSAQGLTRKAAAPEPDGGGAMPAGRAARVTGDNAPLARARAYLLDDPSMREAWDVYRTGFLGEPVRHGRPFPVGFVLENLAATGLVLSGQIVEVLRLYYDNGGDYFDGQGRLARDIDTWGLMLRLAARVPVEAAVAAMLWQPLDAIAVALARDGDIPVWVMETAPPGAQRQLYGMHCTACQAQLLLGLARHDNAEGHALLEAGVARLAATLERAGAAQTVFYTAAYLAGIVHELAQALTGAPWRHRAPLRQHTARLSVALATLRGGMAASPIATPQQAALAVMSDAACDDRRQACREVLLRGQRPDGGWNAEPLFWAPTQQHPGYWYGSRLATTALCHRALAQLQAWQWARE